MALNHRKLAKGMNGRSPQANMRKLLDELSKITIVPEPNKYYTFVYTAKTPRIQYDQFPLILCGSIFQWGFNGYNLHWDETRQYTWAEVETNLYEIDEEDIEFLKNYPTMSIRST